MTAVFKLGVVSLPVSLFFPCPSHVSNLEWRKLIFLLSWSENKLKLELLQNRSAYDVRAKCLSHFWVVIILKFITYICIMHFYTSVYSYPYWEQCLISISLSFCLMWDMVGKSESEFKIFCSTSFYWLLILTSQETPNFTFWGCKLTSFLLKGNPIHTSSHPDSRWCIWNHTMCLHALSCLYT